MPPVTITIAKVANGFTVTQHNKYPGEDVVYICKYECDIGCTVQDIFDKQASLPAPAPRAPGDDEIPF